MKAWLLGALAALALACASPTNAQTSNQVIPGFMSLTGCPASLITPCFVPLAGASIGGSVTATTGAFSASLAATAGKTNSLCGFRITSGGTTTALAVAVTTTGLASGTQNDVYEFPAAGVQGVLLIALPKCIEASAPNTAITVSVPAGGTGTVAALTVWGFQQ